MTCSHSLCARTALTLSMAMLAMATAPASATPVIPAPAPTPAPSGVSGPPDGLIAPPPTNPRPLPTPQIIVPAPSPTPAPRATQPTQRVTPPAPRPSVRPPASVQLAPAPAPAPVAPVTEPLLPEPAPSPLPGMSEESATAPLPDTEVIVPMPVPTDSDTPEWLPLAAIAGAVVLLLGSVLLWRRRRNRPLALPAPEPEARAVPPAPKPATPRAAAPTPQPGAPTSLGRRADLSVDFEALSAQSTLINLRIRYAVTVRNSGTLDAVPVTVRIGLFAGSNVHPQGIAQWFTLDGEALHHAVDRVAVGGDYRFEGELAAPLEALNPITVEGRVLAVPLVAVDARYNHGDGHAPIDGQSARAFVIGREPNKEGTKLAPFRLDQGPTSFAPLGRRDTGISRVV